ncbi:hypothetical protein GCM10014713_59440 [Streptomyces purpureus]|uniref:Uncharacterized protein n=1 Tax=Streptomyces purpureus TaxID=1951 RepID=A0A918HGY8_9ACTN|nr:hypothetical protein GCM10014713_59440 [Streptomyces purpureus]
MSSRTHQSLRGTLPDLATYPPGDIGQVLLDGRLVEHAQPFDEAGVLSELGFGLNFRGPCTLSDGCRQVGTGEVARF